MNDILKAREDRFKLIENKLNNNSIVVVKANTPGFDKNVRSSYFLVDYFKNLIIDKFTTIRNNFYDSADGPYYLLEIKENGYLLKDKFIKIEEEHSLGRLIDLDVFYHSNKSISRSDNNIPRRKCLICNNDAVICGRLKTHSIKELHDKINLMILDFLKIEITKLIDEAIFLEAKLEPKFGLVTLNSKGSHSDMDYSLLEKSRKVIIEPLVKMFEYGFIDNLDDAFKKSREIGKTAEEIMFEITNNINTYKGLIFVLGIVLISLGKCFKDYQFNLFENIRYLGKDLLNEFNNKDNTYGHKAYEKYQITGIRGEVYNGLSSIQKAKNILVDYSDKSLLLTLINLIKNVEDTVLLKRAGSLEKYNFYKNRIGNIKEFDLELINQITDECIENNLSFGGSADLLVVIIFIRKVEDEFRIKYDEKQSNWGI